MSPSISLGEHRRQQYPAISTDVFRPLLAGTKNDGARSRAVPYGANPAFRGIALNKLCRASTWNFSFQSKTSSLIGASSSASEASP